MTSVLAASVFVSTLIALPLAPAPVPQSGSNPIGVSYCVSAENSNGDTPTLSATYQASGGGYDYTLQGSPMWTPISSARIVMGSQQTQTVYGNGWACVGGVVANSPLLTPDGNGVVSYTVDTSVSPWSSILSGSTWYFQCVYVDPAANSSTDNATDGLAITFL